MLPWTSGSSSSAPAQERATTHALKKANILNTGLGREAQPPTPALFPPRLRPLEPFSCSSASVLPQVPPNISRLPAASFRLGSKGGFLAPAPRQSLLRSCSPGSASARAQGCSAPPRPTVPPTTGRKQLRHGERQQRISFEQCPASARSAIFYSLSNFLFY